MRYYRHILLLCFAIITLHSQNDPLDSIKLLLNAKTIDTTVAKTIYRLQLKQISNGEFKEILSLRSRVIPYMQKLDDPFWYAQSMRVVGVALERTGELDNAIKLYQSALSISENIKRPKLEAQCYHNIGFANYLQSSFDKAIIAYLKAIKIREEIKDSIPLGWSLNNIGLIYWRQHSKNDALKHFKHARDIFRKKQFKEGLATATNNVGLIYEELGDNKKALEYYFESYAINLSVNNKSGIALCLNNIGGIYFIQNKLDSCEPYFRKALAINTEINNLEGLELNYRNLSDIYRLNRNYPVALEYINKAINVSKQGNLPQGLISSYDHLALIHEAQGNFKEAYYAHKYYSKLNDSLNFGDKLASLEAAFGKEKLEKEMTALKSEKEITQLRLKQREWVIITAIIGIVILIIVSFVIIKINLQRKKINITLNLKNNEIIKQKEIIEEKSKDITDSILYAKRIQAAILPEIRDFKTFFSDFFVLFEPRDIVSGDFYWLHQIGDKIVVILADCTGHGVPGAFMSIIGHDLLNQIVREDKQTDPATILSALDLKLFQMINKNNTYNNDGMDIAVCTFDITNRITKFCGAGRPLLMQSGGELKVIAGHKFSIGGHAHYANKVFENTELPFGNDTTFYLLSDGYSDQFGGESGKKFKTKKLLETLKNLKDIPLEKQKEILLNTFTVWKGDLAQVDDVCVLGIRL